MNSSQYNSTAQALASPLERDRSASPILPIRGASSPLWSRRSHDSQRSRNTPARPGNVWQRYFTQYISLQRRMIKSWYKLRPWQRAAVVLLNIFLVALAILFLIFSKRILGWVTPVRHKWRDLPAGWLILWVMTFVVSFPPLIGYSLCVTIAGFVFGMKGWLIMSTATVIGSTVSFVVSRTLLRSYVVRMTEKNQRFAALSLVLKHDGLKLLCMIRLCPLPYSFANGAISTIPSVTWPKFMLATAIASPKLLLHIFIGTRLGDLAENDDKMDMKTKLVSYITIIIGVSLGIATGYIIYMRTKARAEVLEAEEAAAAMNGPRTSRDAGADYIDDPDEREAVNILRQADDISLPAYEDDAESGGYNYRDEFTDDEDAHERDVFDIGDGDEEAEEHQKGKR